MRYATARLFSELEQRALRIYITDAMYITANNTASFSGGNVLSKRFYDIVYADKNTADSVSADDIIMGVINRAGLGVETKNG